LKINSIPRHARTISLGVLITLVAAPMGCSTTSTSGSSASNAVERQRTVSQEAALADFDTAWQLVNDTHYDTEFNGVDWAAMKTKYRPQAMEAMSQSELRVVIQNMLNELGQSHFGIIPSDDAEPETTTEVEITEIHDHSDAPESDDEVEISQADVLAPSNDGDGEGDANTGLDLRIVDGQAVVSSVRDGSSADRAGVKTGWIIERIRTREVSALLERLSNAISEEEMGIYAVGAINSRIEGRAGSSIEVTFLNGTDDEVVLELEREPRPGETVKFGNLPPVNTQLDWSQDTFTDGDGNEVSVGIIRFNIWMIPIAPKFERAMYELRDCDGIIIDIRGNPGGVGVLSSAMGRFIMSEKGSLGTMTMRGAEMQFNIEPVVVTTWGEELDPFTGPVAILQDSGSASTSEVFAGGLQSLGRVKVFGTRSAGMALPSNMDKLPSGDVLLHAIADFTSSTGARMEHTGVIPDFEVKLSREDLLMGIDTPEQSAKEWISESVKAR
jgi:carboxyl-terminal processing protease